jgi:hypothetical protein
VAFSWLDQKPAGLGFRASTRKGKNSNEDNMANGSIMPTIKIEVFHSCQKSQFRDGTEHETATAVRQLTSNMA